MPFPLTKPGHIAAMRKANAETARRVKPWTYRGPWSAAQRARSPFNNTQHGADSLAVDFAVSYTAALRELCRAICEAAGMNRQLGLLADVVAEGC